jgi:hypothetical protein
MEVRKMYVGSQASVVERARTFQGMESDLRKASRKIIPKCVLPFLEKELMEEHLKEDVILKNNIKFHIIMIIY